jgi:DNA-binding CsgD family transcriptional regulator
VEGIPGPRTHLTRLPIRPAHARTERVGAANARVLAVGLVLAPFAVFEAGEAGARHETHHYAAATERHSPDVHQRCAAYYRGNPVGVSGLRCSRGASSRRWTPRAPTGTQGSRCDVLAAHRVDIRRDRCRKPLENVWPCSASRYHGVLMSREGDVTRMERESLHSLIQRIQRYDVTAAPVLETIVDPLRDLLHASHACCYGLRDEGDRMQCAFMYTQLPRTITADVDRLLSARTESPGHYDPRLPGPEQRNRVVLFTANEVATVSLQPIFQRYKIASAQIRVLICDGSVLLAWVGAFRDEPFTERDEWLLRQLVQPLRQRLLLEQRLEMAAATTRSLDFLLDRIGSAAFVVNARGQIAPNAAAKAMLDADGRTLAARVLAATRSGDPQFEVHTTPSNGIPTQYLVVMKPSADVTDARAAQAAARWGLTRRQRDVLVCIVKGHSNASVSAALGISERTVEVHMTAIFDRAQCSSRAELISLVLLPA